VLDNPEKPLPFFIKPCPYQILEFVGLLSLFFPVQQHKNESYELMNSLPY
jgi:hypothetical protein